VEARCRSATPKAPKNHAEGAENHAEGAQNENENPIRF
jgi:hypothetical protein